jgi:hypothetical protein
MRAARVEAANGRPERLWNVPEAEWASIQRKESQMDRRALGSAAPMRTFAALAALLAAGLTLPASQPRPAPARPRPAPAWSRSVPRLGPAAFRPARPRAAGMVIRMAGPAGRAPARPEFHMHTLTIRGTSLAGTPDTGDLVQLFNVDNTALLDPQAGAGVFRDGLVKYSVPSGHYFAIAEFGGSARTPGNRFVVLPQFSVIGNRTVIIRGRAADSRITMVTPRPATALTTDAWLLRTGRSGPPIVLEMYFPGTPVWLSPAGTRPTVGTLRVAVNQHLESPPGRAVPYEYTLSYTDPPGIIPAQRYVVRAAALATVHERFYQAVPVSGGWGFNGSFPATNPNVGRAWFGFIEPAGPSLRLPGRLTEYAGGTGTGRMEWFGQYEPGSAPWQSGDLRLLRPGERLTENWSAYPLHPTANVLLETEPNMFNTTQPSAVRAGNTLSLEVDPFGDNQAGHEIGGLLGSGVTGTYRIEQDGTRIAGGNAVTQTSPYGEFYTTATLAPKPATIRFSLDLTRASKLSPLSTATRTAWTFRTAPPGSAVLPAGWSCAPLTRSRDCAAQPMMTLTYRVAELALDGTAPAGRQVLHVLAGHLQAVRAAPVTRASVSVSFDGGKTWHPARVSGHGGSYAAVFTAPPGALVTLRTSAADAAGGTVTETIASAYRTGR